MYRRHPAWPERKPEWVMLAPGVKWLLTRPNGEVQTLVSAEVSTRIGRIFRGLAEQSELGIELQVDEAWRKDVERLSNASSLLSAALYAQHCLSGWEGLNDPETGEPLDHTDPDAIRNALIEGPPGQDGPLLVPFLAWIEGPKKPVAAETFRLRARARDFWSGGAERCQACREAQDLCAKGAPVDGALCPQFEHAPLLPEGVAAFALLSSTPGLWARAGMDGLVVGLDYRASLLVLEEQLGPSCDHGAVFKILQAIEQGRLEAQADKQAEAAAAREMKFDG